MWSIRKQHQQQRDGCWYTTDRIECIIDYSNRSNSTDPQFSNPLRRAIKSACWRSLTSRSLTRNELVKTCGKEPWPEWVAATGGADDDATTRTTVRLASNKVQQTGGDVPALQERETALNMARFREKPHGPCATAFFLFRVFPKAFSSIELGQSNRIGPTNDSVSSFFSRGFWWPANLAVKLAPVDVEWRIRCRTK